MTSVFQGATAAGTWNLYLDDDFTGWLQEAYDLPDTLAARRAKPSAVRKSKTARKAKARIGAAR